MKKINEELDQNYKNTNNNNPIYVLDIDGKPLMPTFKYGKIRKMIKNGDAVIHKREPFFTIQLTYSTTSYKQEIFGGIDVGDTIGVSAISNKNEILSAELISRSDSIKKRIDDKRMYRRTRRNKLRYREARFNNRSASRGNCKVCGGNTPTGQLLCRKCAKDGHNKHKLTIKDEATKRLNATSKHFRATHLSLIDKISKILPVTNWNIEIAKFDTQKINSPDIQSTDYQQGNLFNYDNLRSFIFARDEHKCMNPKCKNHVDCKVPLFIHHIKQRSDGGTNKPDNLISLCGVCHSHKNHQEGGLLHKSTRHINTWLDKNKKYNNTANTARVSSVSSYLIDELNNNFKESVNQTFGYITSRTRNMIGISKIVDGKNMHSNDAFCIAIPIYKYSEFRYDDKNQAKPVLKTGVIFNKIENSLQLTQMGKRGGSTRRGLSSFTDAEYIDSRDYTIRSGKQLCKIMSDKHKKVVSENLRIYRLRKVSKYDQIVSFTINSKVEQKIIKIDYNVVIYDNTEQKLRLNEQQIIIRNGTDVYVEDKLITSKNNLDKLKKYKKVNYIKFKINKSTQVIKLNSKTVQKEIIIIDNKQYNITILNNRKVYIEDILIKSKIIDDSIKSNGSIDNRKGKSKYQYGCIVSIINKDSKNELIICRGMLNLGTRLYYKNKYDISKNDTISIKNCNNIIRYRNGFLIDKN